MRVFEVDDSQEWDDVVQLTPDEVLVAIGVAAGKKLGKHGITQRHQVQWERVGKELGVTTVRIKWAKPSEGDGQDE